MPYGAAREFGKQEFTSQAVLCVAPGVPSWNLAKWEWVIGNCIATSRHSHIHMRGALLAARGALSKPGTCMAACVGSEEERAGCGLVTANKQPRAVPLRSSPTPGPGWRMDGLRPGGGGGSQNEGGPGMKGEREEPGLALGFALEVRTNTTRPS